MSRLARSIFITGASRGLGLEFIKQIVKSSYHPEVLIAACRNPSNANDLQEIAKENTFVKVLKLDVENDEDIDVAVKETKSIVGEFGLNMLINNAGINEAKGDGGGIRMQTRERMQRHFNVNSTSPIIVTQKFLPLLELAASNQKDELIGCRKAACIMISSIMGSQAKTFEAGFGTKLDYKCSKSALNMATIILSQDLKKSGILVMSIHPGWVQTDLGGPQADLTAHESVESILQTLQSSGEKENGSLLNFKNDIIPF